MKKLFTLWVAFMFVSLAKAEIYEVGADGNDNAITLTTGGIDNGDIVIDIGLINPTASIVGMDAYVDFSGGNDKISTDVELSNRCNDSFNVFTGIVTKEGENEGQLYLSVVSMTSKSLSGTDGTVATLYLTGVNEGQYKLTIKGTCYDETNSYKCESIEINFTYANGTITLVQDNVDEYSELVYSTNEIFANTASGTFPVGWVANDNGTIHQYGLTESGEVWNYNWGGNLGGGGGRSMTGYSGDLNGAAIYWRCLDGSNTLGTLTFGEQVKDYILSDGTLDLEVPEGISLWLDARKYQISIRMCAWKNLNSSTDAVDADNAPKFDFTLEDLDGIVYAQFSDILAMPNVNGQQNIEVTDVPRSQMDFTVEKAGYYILKFSTTQASSEYLLGGVDLMAISQNNDNEILEDSLIILSGDTLLLEGQRFPDNNDIFINNGISLVLQGSEGMVSKNVTLTTDLSTNIFSQILSSTDNITVTGDVSQRIYTQGMTWNFMSLPFDCDLSRLVNEDGSLYAIRYYDGASRAANSAAQGNWKDYGRGDIIPMGTGFIFMTQNDSWTKFYAFDNENKSNVFRSTNSDVSFGLALNENDQASHRGWNLVGNPYANFYNSQQLGFSGVLTLWNGTTYEAVYPSDEPIALKPGQAFFVQCQGDNAIIDFPGTGRQLTSEVSNSAKARSANVNINRKQMNLILSDQTFTDKTRVVINEEAGEGYELDCDAGKFMSLRPEVPQLYSIGRDGTHYAINERPKGDGKVALGLYIPEDGEYTISVTRNDAERVRLSDSETGQTVDLDEGGYTFQARKGTYARRLSLWIDTAATGIIEIASEGGADSPASWYTLDGRPLQGQPSTTGVYLVKEGSVVRKMYVKK